ncbi:MAG: C10 family peptidase [Bacteroidales bacterium]|nr:C10 family peptidase [Candidatus Sodaliphilus fimicaballi]
MKRIISLLTFVACFALSQAATITQSQALERALQFMNKNASLRIQSNTQQTGYQLAHACVSKAGESEIYVFNRTGKAGYLIVAADDAVIPVLGYADSGSFNAQDIPDGLQYWLDEYQRQFEYLKLHPDEVRVAQTIDKEVKPLLTCNWNQSAPYNNMCPIYKDSVRCVTGCVATAVAQIMYYHKWPERGTGSHSYNWRINGKEIVTLSADFSNSVYDWDNMCDNYDSSNTEVQNAAVAKLMSDVGISVNMKYGEVSGAYTVDVVKALSAYFGYDKSVQMYTRNYYDVATWEKIIRDELDVARPIYYSGFGSDGHAFVCDGYDTEGYFHFNWGWGGMSDGYFILSMLNPREHGTGSIYGGFNIDQAIITRIMPNDGDSPSTDVGTIGTVTNISSGVSSVALGESASFYVNPIMSGIKDWNESLQWFFAVTEPKIDATSYIDTCYVYDATDISVGIVYYLRDAKFTPSPKLAEGKYYIRYAYLKDGKNFGFFTGLSPNNYVVEMEVRDGYAYFSKHNEPSYIVASDMVTSINPVYKNNPFNLQLKVTNNGLIDYYDYIYISLMQGSDIKQQDDPIWLGLAANGSINLSFDINPKVTAGDYMLTISNAQKEIIGSIPITVRNTVIVLDDFTLGAPEMPANDVRATAKITLKDGYLSNVVSLFVYTYINGSRKYSRTITSDTITLKSGESATVHFKGEVDGAVGSTYHVFIGNPTKSGYNSWTSYREFKVCDYDPYTSVIEGDINGDGVVDIADVNAVIDMVLGLKDNAPEADVNGDGTVDVADMNAVINIILGL